MRIPAANPAQVTTRRNQVNYLHELRELARRIDLIRYLTVSTLRSGHRDLVLGQLWWLLEPLLTMLMFVFLVQVIFNKGTENYVAFVFCSILPFRWFTQAITQTQGVMGGIGGLMREVAFPKAVYPIALTLSNFFNFLIGFALLVIVILMHGIMPTLNWLWLIPSILQLAVFTLGMTLLIGALTIFFQDLKNILGFVFQLLFYLSPSLYTIERVPARFRDIYQLNPFCGIFTNWRQILLEGRAPNLESFMNISLVSVAVLIVGYMVFVRLEKVFPKIV